VVSVCCILGLGGRVGILGLGGGVGIIGLVHISGCGGSK
jgi:hypothetical protein